MTTEQKFFLNIANAGGAAYGRMSGVIGDFNKNIGLSAKFYENANWVLGNTTTENYDLASLFNVENDFANVFNQIGYTNDVRSNNGELLKQSLQNVLVGISNTSTYSEINVSTHISTDIMEYRFGISSAFLSGQIYSVSASGLNTDSRIKIPYSFNTKGNIYDSWLFDVPMDFAVYGIDNYSTYTNSSLIRFEHGWEHNNGDISLIVPLNFQTVQPANYYLAFYWGCTDSSFISTGFSTGSVVYFGTSSFIDNIGINTTGLISKNLADVSGRKNFWSNTAPYSVGFSTQSFVDERTWLWADKRINGQVYDGTVGVQIQPLRYPVLNDLELEDAIGVSTHKNLYIYSSFKTSGTAGEVGLNATPEASESYSSNYNEAVDSSLIVKELNNSAPLSFISLSQNPKKSGLNYGNGYSVVSVENIVPSAFIKPAADIKIWNYFVQSMVLAKNVYVDNNKIIQSYLGLLDNFIADFLFGVNYNNVNDYFVGESLNVSRKALKNFTQPYGTSDIAPMNFPESTEYSIYNAVNIVPSKQYFIFDKGYVQGVNKFKLPQNTSFEIFKPISLVCNGLDPYSQGIGLAFDYTLNLVFEYDNQNKFNKTLYLMSSKYLVSKSEYESRIKNNQSVLGYYYLADPNSTDYNSYSVSSIPEFRIYGYAGLIPDLKDGVIRPIEARYSQDEYLIVDRIYASGTSTGGVLDSLESDFQESLFISGDKTYQKAQFVSLSDLSLCATQYALNRQPYWNTDFQSPYSLYSQGLTDRSIAGYTVLSAVINNGIATGLGSPPYTINSIPVGYNCQVQFVNLDSFGSGQTPGTYKTWVKPSNEYITNEQPALIEYKVNSTGIVDPSSVVILDPGSNFYFNFGTFLTDPPLSGIGATHSYANFVMNNVSYFSATTDANGVILTMNQTDPPALGYPVGFKLNTKAFVGLGYTVQADIGIIVENTPTVDSFLIAESGLSAGDLEGFVSFENPDNIFASINFSSGSDEYIMYEEELLNTINVPFVYGKSSINYVSIECRLVELFNTSLSGGFRVNIYSSIKSYNRPDVRVLVASSSEVSYTEINKNSYTTLEVPINYTFLDTTITGEEQEYWISISQNLKGCFLAVKGQYFGATFSNFSIGTNIASNSTPLIVSGSIGTTNGADLDLSKAPIGITSLPNPSLISSSQSSFIVYLRRDPSYSLDNAVSLGFNSIYQGIAASVISGKINISALSTSFTGVAFTFGSPILPTTIISNAFIHPDSALLENQIYVSRSLDDYNYINIGMATSSQVFINNSFVNFNFVFNKIFGGLGNEIYAGFNYYDNSKFGLANPNMLRVSEPFNVVESWYSFKTKEINKPLSIYPRSFFDRSTYLGSSYVNYAYIGYTHDAYVNVGYNSSGQFYQENSILLSAYPRWKTTWMERQESTIKNFEIYDVIQSLYQDSINYAVGSANTFIGLSTNYKTAVFEGVFKPGGNLALPVAVNVGIGTSSGVQLYINNNTLPLIDTFSVTSIGNTSIAANLTVEERNDRVYFKAYYYTFSTASITIQWNTGTGNTLIDFHSSDEVLPEPISINSGYPIDNIVFFNVSQTEEDSLSINYGYPLGDSFVIRST